MGVWNRNPFFWNYWLKRECENERVYESHYGWGFAAFTFDPNGPIEYLSLIHI